MAQALKKGKHVSQYVLTKNFKPKNITIMETLAKKETAQLRINTEAYINLSENDHSVLAEILLPGYDSSNVTITYEDGKLIIESKEGALNEHFQTKPFKRSIVLPNHLIDEDSIKASFSNGILSIEAKKTEKEKKQIAIS